MKKALVLALTGVCVVVAFATESDPSNTVGFINQTVPVGYSTFSACPIGAGVGVSAATYLAGQGSPTDKIFEYTPGGWVPYDYAFWASSLNFNYNSHYVYQNLAGFPQSLVIAGDVIAEGTPLLMGNFVPGFNGYGHPLPMNNNLNVDDLDLIASGYGTAGDAIYEMSSGSWVPYVFPFLPTLNAGESYIVKSGSTFTWNYTVGATPVAVETPSVRKTAKSQSISNLD